MVLLRTPSSAVLVVTSLRTILRGMAIARLCTIEPTAAKNLVTGPRFAQNNFVMARGVYQIVALLITQSMMNFSCLNVVRIEVMVQSLLETPTWTPCHLNE